VLTYTFVTLFDFEAHRGALIQNVLHVLPQRNTLSIYFMDKIIIYLSIHLCFIQSVSGGIVNILGGSSMG